MSPEVTVFRGDDYAHYGEVRLLPLLRGFFEPLIGRDLTDAQFQLVFLPLADSGTLPGAPSMVNLRASHGYVYVRIVVDDEVLYRHPHPVREIVGRQLQKLLAEREPGETRWGFGIRSRELDRVAMSHPGTQSQDEGRRNRPQLFQMEEVEGPEPPATTLPELGVDVSADDPNAIPDGPVCVVIDESVREALAGSARFSTEVEEGGFLAGRVYRDANRPGRHIVEITSVIPAEGTGASMLTFTFTGESFLLASERIATSGRDEELLGWYHTHLFPATDALGLSSVDVDLHQSTFRRPWQVAALINIAEGGRVLRFYAEADQEMAQASYWTVKR